MAREIRLGQTTNADVYLEGNRHVGRIKEFGPDKIGYETVSHEALGMKIKIDLPGRTMEPLNASITFAWLETDLLLRTLLPNRAVNFQFEQFVDIFSAEGFETGESYRLNTNVSLLFKSSSFDAFKNGEGMGIEHECSIINWTMKSTESDGYLFEFAPLANIARVGGQDVWS